DMIFIPLVLAFVSLIIFYLIGVAAQGIKLWLGKRLPAELMAKYDTGTYELKSVSDTYKRRNKQYLNDIREIQDQLNLKIEQADNDYKQIESLTNLNDTYSRSISEMTKEANSLKDEKTLNENKIHELLLSNAAFEVERDAAIEALKKIKTPVNKLSDNPRTLFSDSLWTFSKIQDNGTLNYVSMLSLDSTNNFQTEMGIIVSITRFEFNSEKNIVTFMKNNIEARLVVKNPNTLVGSEGSDTVIYIRNEPFKAS
ncbi:MAG: hypothetical protein HY062_01265, partial [Bacteroidetes bacterium]|nr:hypothetical protein [Bacteroidota bacterium]